MCTLDVPLTAIKFLFQKKLQEPEFERINHRRSEGNKESTVTQLLNKVWVKTSILEGVGSVSFHRLANQSHLRGRMSAVEVLSERVGIQDYYQFVAAYVVSQNSICEKNHYKYINTKKYFVLTNCFVVVAEYSMCIII